MYVYVVLRTDHTGKSTVDPRVFNEEYAACRVLDNVAQDGEYLVDRGWTMERESDTRLSVYGVNGGLIHRYMVVQIVID